MFVTPFIHMEHETKPGSDSASRLTQTLLLRLRKKALIEPTCIYFFFVSVFLLEFFLLLFDYFFHLTHLFDILI